MSILLKNATYIDWETLEFKQTNIVAEEGVNKSISFESNPSNINENNITEILDCTGKYVTKSFVVGHHHVYSALAKGMPAPKKSPQNFYEILQYIWWTLDKSLDKESIEASALATAIACAKSGATFAIDHHASPNFIKGSLEVIAQAFDKVGVNHLLCYEITDRDGLDKAQQGLEETDNYLKHSQGLVGLHASFTVGDDSMKKAAELMQKHNSGFHIHVAEDGYDEEHAIKNFNKRVVERLQDYGVLNSSKTILGHCLHLDNNEKSIIKNSNCWVVQNMESNLNNNVGYFNAEGLGDKIILGTDGMHSDMLQSAKAAFFVGQHYDNITYPSVYERFRNAHRYLKENSLDGDGANNLVVLDYNSTTAFNQNNFLGHFVFGINSGHVSDVVANGKIIVKDRTMTTIDEKDVLAFTKEQSLKLWERMQSV